jgi:hypothetical protein
MRCSGRVWEGRPGWKAGQPWVPRGVGRASMAADNGANKETASTLCSKAPHEWFAVTEAHLGVQTTRGGGGERRAILIGGRRWRSELGLVSRDTFQPARPAASRRPSLSHKKCASGDGPTALTHLHFIDRAGLALLYLHTQLFCRHIRDHERKNTITLSLTTQHTSELQWRGYITSRSRCSTS